MITTDHGPLPTDGPPALGPWAAPDPGTVPGVRTGGFDSPPNAAPPTDTRDSGTQPDETPEDDGPNWIERWGLNALLLAITAIATWWAANGWAAAAEDWMGVRGVEAYLVFAVFEGAAGALVMLATRARLADDGAAMLWLMVWVIAGIAVSGQLWHALESEHPQSAIVYGTASALAVLLWQVKARRTHRERLKKLGRIAPALPSQGGARWFRFPRQVWRAQSVAAWEGITDPNQAISRARELYPGGNMPWDSAQRRAAEKAARAKVEIDHDVPAAQRAIEPPEDAPRARPATASPQVSSSPKPKRAARRPAVKRGSSDGAGAAVRQFRTADESLAILRKAYPDSIPSHGEVFEALGINSKSTSNKLRGRLEEERQQDPGADQDEDEHRPAYAANQ